MPIKIFYNGTVQRGKGLPDDTRLLIVDGVVHEWDDEVASRADEVVDLAGRYIGPAFGDGHVHLLHAGRELLGPRITGLDTVDDIVDEVRRFALEHPGQEWILGGSYNASIIQSGLFDARWLDEAVPDRPVALYAWDYHTVWCNSLALQLAGIDGATPEPELGSIPRRPDGSPIGVLMEWGAIDLIRGVAPTRPIEESVEAIRLATRELASRGVTWAQDAWVDPEDIEAWEAAAAAGALNCRVDLALRADPLRWEEQRTQLDELRTRVCNLDDRLTCRTVKFFVDGVTENHTAHLLHEYEDKPCRGMAMMDAETLNSAVAFVDQLGFEVHLHAIGDAAVRAALDALEYAQSTNGPRDRRWTIAHAQLVAPEDLSRFADLNVVVCFQPLWAGLDDLMTVLTLPHLGEARGNAAYAIGTMLRSGAPVSFGSDWPCSSFDPFAGIRTAVTRQTDAGHPAGGWIPAERISVEDALDIYRRGVAYQGGFESKRGKLAAGMDADFVVLDRDPRSVPSQEISAVVVEQTFLNGASTSHYSTI